MTDFLDLYRYVIRNSPFYRPAEVLSKLHSYYGLYKPDPLGRGNYIIRNKTLDEEILELKPEYNLFDKFNLFIAEVARYLRPEPESIAIVPPVAAQVAANAFEVNDTVTESDPDDQLVLGGSS